ncbi:MAG: helix-hairpin-helix domain-containing protein [Nocardioides sp.]
MRSRSSSVHQEALTRRLATLSAELAAVRDEPGSPVAAVEPVGEGATSGRALPPSPGRHAARRPGRPGLPAGWAPVSRLVLSASHVGLIALAAALALGGVAWWAIRERPVVEVPARVSASRPAAPEPSSAPASQVPSGTASGAAVAEQKSLVVDVAGKVRRPGIAVLPPGSRVIDAVEAAGGARRGVNLKSLNLARPLVDGEQVLVGVAAPVGWGAAAAAPPSPGSTPGLVNLNTATQAELETLPGVGPVTAQAILDWRAEHQVFGAVEELLGVKGIGEATLAEIAPHVTV